MCDAKVEDPLAGQFLHDTRKCDRHTRWICVKCSEDEVNDRVNYYRVSTVLNRYVNSIDWGTLAVRDLGGFRSVCAWDGSLLASTDANLMSKVLLCLW